MRDCKAENAIVVLDALLLFGIVLCIVLEKSSLVSLLFMATFGLLLFAVIIQLLGKKINKVYLIAFFCIICCIFNSALSITHGNYSISFELSKKLIMFISTILYFAFCMAIDVTEKLVKLILLANIAISLIYPIAYFVLNIRTVASAYTSSLTMNFTNPNALALFLLHSLLFVFIGIVYFKPVAVKIFLFLVEVLLFYILFKTEARSAVGAFAVFVGMSVVDMIFFNKIKIKPWMAFLVIIFPLVFAIAYMQMHYAGNLDNLNLGGELFNKTNSTRVEVWGPAFEKIKEHFFIGNYAKLNAATGQSQLHNTHVDTLATYGFLPLVIFIVMLNYMTKNILAGINTVFQKRALFAFFAVIFMGAFEAALVSGGTGLYVMSGAFIILARYSSKTQEEAVNEIKGNGYINEQRL